MQPAPHQPGSNIATRTGQIPKLTLNTGYRSPQPSYVVVIRGCSALSVVACRTSSFFGLASFVFRPLFCPFIMAFVLRWYGGGIFGLTMIITGTIQEPQTPPTYCCCPSVIIRARELILRLGKLCSSTTVGIGCLEPLAHRCKITNPFPKRSEP